MKRISTLCLIMMMSLAAFSQAKKEDYTIVGDVTSKLQNADFSQGTPTAVTVRTYAKDMTDDGVGNGGEARYGLQDVPGWTAIIPSDNIKRTNESNEQGDARAGGTYPYLEFDPESAVENRPGMGSEGFYPPYADASLTGNALGMTAVWSQTAQYTQPLTLEAGAYMIVIKYCNVGTGTAPSSNLFGFIVSDDEKYMSTATSFPVGLQHDAATDIDSYEWSEDVIIFKLDEQKSGNMSLGFTFGGGSAATLHMYVDNVKVYQIDPNDLIRDEINAKKVELLELIQTGQKYGADTDAAQAVYDNPKATMQDVLDAIELQKENNKAATTDLSEAFIKNPHFSLDDAVTGGICTYNYDCEKNNIPTSNYSMLPLTGWVASKTDNGVAAGVYEVGSNAFLGGTDFRVPATMSDGSESGKLLGFVSCWSFNASYTQQVTIPAGKYILTFHYYNVGGTNAINKNQMGFISNDGTEYLGKSTTFPVGKWTSEIIEFELAEQTAGKFSMGYTATNVGSGLMPHLFIEGVSLIYIGTGIDPEYLALQAAVENAENILATSQFNAELQEQFTGVTTIGRNLVDNHDGTSEDYHEALVNITDLLDAVEASIKAYAELAKFGVEEDGALVKALAKYEANPAYAPLIAELGQLADDVNAALADFSWTTEKINETIASLPDIIKKKIKTIWDGLVESGTVLDEPIDISPLFDTLGATYSTNYLVGANVVDKQWNYGSASNFRTQYGTMEVYNQTPFEVSQTIEDLPAGTYKVFTRGAYRTAGNAANAGSYDPSAQYVFVFANSAKTALSNNYDFASSETKDGWTEAVAGEGQYVINNQKAAHDVFEDAAYDEFTYRGAQAVISDGRPLKFGVKANEMQSENWTVWYTFEIFFNNTSADDKNVELEALMEEAYQLMDEATVISESYDALNDAYDAGDEALESTNPTLVDNAIAFLRSSIAEAHEALTEREQLLADLTFFSDLQAQYIELEASSTDLTDILDEYDDQSVFDNVDQIKTVEKELVQAWYSFILSQDLSKATEENPVDVTGVILNPDFELLNTRFWTISEGIGQNVGYQSNATYKNADDEVVISHFMEAWRNATEGTLDDGTLDQTINCALPAGYYLLECDGFAMNQTADFADPIKGVYLYTLDTTGEDRSTISNVEENNNTAKHISIFVESDGETPITIGVKIENTNANWFTVDNFKLAYVGTEEPVGINDLEVEELTAAPSTIYTIAGVRAAGLQRGLNIVVDANGKARKVLVK